MEPNASSPSLIFLHGLESSSQGYKARLLRSLFPAMIIPDFSGSLEQRMAQLAPIMATGDDWAMIGSSFGGLMATLWASMHPSQLRKLVLLAPALVPPYFTAPPPASIRVPTLIYHGRYDTVVPLEPVQHVARQAFVDLDFRIVDDDHMLRATVDRLDWRVVLG